MRDNKIQKSEETDTRTTDGNLYKFTTTNGQEAIVRADSFIEAVESYEYFHSSFAFVRSIEWIADHVINPKPKPDEKS